jgi:hypothetical protein
MQIPALRSGGIIVTYRCTNRCGHCLYNSGPHRSRDYIEQQELLGCLETLRDLGCASVHIGGGEPFLNRAGLKMTLQFCQTFGMNVDYVETNGVWHCNHEQSVRQLLALKEAGLRRLLVSISPMHNACVPFRKTKGVLAACREARIEVFPWAMDFYEDLEKLDENTLHELDEFEERLGPDYRCRILERYWTHLGGRALKTFRDCFPAKAAEEIARDNGSCLELESTDHFHLDLHGNYIPGLCSGLSIRRQDLGRTLDPDLYPLLTALHEQGVGALLELGRSEFGFVPNPQGYISKCDLCTDIRGYLVRVKDVRAVELQPLGFYAGG